MLVGHFVARYRDLMSMAGNAPCTVIGESGVIRDRPGFELELLGGSSIADRAYATDRHEVLMVMRGRWRLSWDDGETVLDSGDTCAIPPGVRRRLAPAMSGEASIYRVTATDDPAGATRAPM